MTRRLVITIVLVGLATVVPARAEQGQWCRFDPPIDEVYAGGDPRVRVEDIGGTRTVVLVPPGYHPSSERRYPVVWLFHGGVSHEDCFLLRTDLIDLTARQPEHRQAIVVMPDGGPDSAWVDSRDGQLRGETRFLQEFIPAIDARYNTIADGRHRAIAGFSAGGFGASHIAARYPDLFVAMAGLSGIVEMSETVWFTGGVYGTAQYWWPMQWGGLPSLEGSIGHPVLESIRWRDIDPVSLAPNFGAMDVSVFSGNGVPCDAWDIEQAMSMGPFMLAEEPVFEWSHHLSAALRAAGIAHVFEPRCGLHHYGWVERELHEWWPTLFDSFGKERPPTFDHRRAIPSFSVWGWTFTADPGRAPEFLDVLDASCAGLGLVGSGTTIVTTEPCFSPGARVLVNGAPRVADAEGRVTFEVDLGSAHVHQQYSPAARALEAAGGYWTSARVVLEEM